jgi:hypothetical protein
LTTFTHPLPADTLSADFSDVKIRRAFMQHTIEGLGKLKEASDL